MEASVCGLDGGIREGYTHLLVKDVLDRVSFFLGEFVFAHDVRVTPRIGIRGLVWVRKRVMTGRRQDLIVATLLIVRFPIRNFVGTLERALLGREKEAGWSGKGGAKALFTSHEHTITYIER